MRVKVSMMARVRVLDNRFSEEGVGKMRKVGAPIDCLGCRCHDDHPHISRRVRGSDMCLEASRC